MSILRLLCSDGFITVNKELISIVGLDAAVLMGELASEYQYWKTNDKNFNGEFYSTIKNIESKTTLNGDRQRKAIEELQKRHWITVTKKGLPARRFFKIHVDVITNYFVNKLPENPTTSCRNSSQQGIKESNSNKKRTIKSNERINGSGISPNNFIDDDCNLDTPINLFAKYMGRKIKPIEEKQINEFIKEVNVSSALVICAFEDNDYRKSLTAKNIIDTLRKWHNNGITTVEEANIFCDKEHQENKRKYATKRNSLSTSWPTGAEVGIGGKSGTNLKTPEESSIDNSGDNDIPDDILGMFGE